MGRAKAWLPWCGRSMIEHVVDRLRPVVDEIIVVTSGDLSLPSLPAKIVSDRESGLGPLAGIREGLAAARSEWAFVTSVDAPFLGGAFVKALFDVGTAAAPVAEDHVQVLSAIYPRDAWKKADALLSRGVRRPRTLLEEVGYEPLDLPASGGRPAWTGFNTPGEYLDCVREIEPGATAEVEFLGRAAAILPTETSLQRVPVGTLGEIFQGLIGAASLVESDRIGKAHLVSLGGRDLVRDLSVPVGSEERVSVIDAMVGG